MEVRPQLDIRKCTAQNTQCRAVFGDFICQKVTVFSQQGCNVRTVAPLAVICRSEMSQCETDSKTRRYFVGDIPETPVGVLIYGKN